MQIQDLEGKLSTRVEAPAEAVGAPAEARDVEEEDVVDESLQAIFDEAETEVPIVEVPPPPLVHKVVAKKKVNKKLGEGDPLKTFLPVIFSLTFQRTRVVKFAIT